MIPFIYKYMPKTVDEFELDSKSSLSYQTNVLLLGPERSGKTTLASLLVKDIETKLRINNIEFFKTFYESLTAIN